MLPEIILQKAIATGLSAIRKDKRIVNYLTKQFPVQHQEEFKKFLDKQINLVVNMPRGIPQLPLLALTLRSEQESQSFLNDYLGVGNAETEVLGELGGIGSTGTVGTPGRTAKILGPLEVASTSPASAAGLSSYRIQFSNASQELIDYYFSGLTRFPAANLHVLSGPNQGSVLRVTKITSLGLDISGQVRVNFGNGDLVELREAPGKDTVYGQPQAVFSTQEVFEKKGANYDYVYDLTVISGNQEEVLLLCVLIKSLLFAQRGFLEEQGLKNLKITASDLQINPDTVPNDTYRRVLSLTFTMPFDTIIPIEVIKSIRLLIFATDEQHYNDPPNLQNVVLDEEITING